jgi:hypothetical protein
MVMDMMQITIIGMVIIFIQMITIRIMSNISQISIYVIPTLLVVTSAICPSPVVFCLSLKNTDYSVKSNILVIEITPSTNPEKDIKPKMETYGVQKDGLQSNPEIYRNVNMFKTQLLLS